MGKIIFDDEISCGDEIHLDGGWVDLISSAKQISSKQRLDFIVSISERFHYPLHPHCFYAILHLKVGDNVKKIRQGKFEIFTTREDAIDKLIQLQGICTEELDNEQPIEFYCSKNGKIIIASPPRRDYEHSSSTELFAEVVTEGSKTFVTYYTKFSKFDNVSKLIYFAFRILTCIIAIIIAVISKLNPIKIMLLFLCLVSFFFWSSTFSKEGLHSVNDSDIMIKELEKRVNAVNLWDK